MAVISPDVRTAQQKADDEKTAGEPHLPPPRLPADAKPVPVESLLKPRSPQAIAGVVKNGVVRPIDPSVTLKENSKVIIVASGVD